MSGFDRVTLEQFYASGGILTVGWDPWAIEEFGSTQAVEISLTAWVARHMRCWPCAFGVGFVGLGEAAGMPVGACVAMGARPTGSPHVARNGSRATRRSHAPEQISLGL